MLGKMGPTIDEVSIDSINPTVTYTYNKDDWGDFGEVPIGNPIGIPSGTPVEMPIYNQPNIITIGNEEQVPIPVEMPHYPRPEYTEYQETPREGNYRIRDVLGHNYTENVLQDLLSQFQDLLKDDKDVQKNKLSQEIELRKIKIQEAAPVFTFEGKRFS